ncbi:hypothetical protein EMCRGX_G019413 [Ephydatia muelleri]|eukprot:Em0011g580a
MAVQQQSDAAEQKPFAHFATTATHAGQDPDQWNIRSVVPPISLSTTFKQSSPGKPFPYEYSRGGNPTRDVFEKCVSALEGAKHGIAAASGLAAQSMIAQTLKTGDHIICMNDVYGGTHRYFRLILSQFGVKVTFLDASNLKAVEEAFQENTKVVWVESPTNPLLRLVDLAAVVALTREKKPDAIVVVDNTFMSPYFQRPLDFGADIVYHSVTKYLNGHSDVIMGVVCTNSDELGKKLRFQQMAGGAVPSPFECYLANRGLKTLHLRMREHQKNAFAVARFLQASPHVTEVMYPGLPSHPQHELAKRQCRGFSGMVSFRIKGTLENAKKFLESLKVFILAESLGGYESLVDLPALMTHASIPAEEREKLGISDTLIRLSVGLEDEEDIVDDLDQALKASQQL